MRQFAVDFVDQIAEISGSFVIDVLEEHDSIEILWEILDFVVG